jgi:hypothetical protein
LQVIRVLSGPAVKRYLRTQTGLPHFGKGTGILGKVLKAIDPNPDYALEGVWEWLIEFDETGSPWREIGLNDQGNPVLSGPDARNLGFWHDTDMRWEDFEGEEIPEHAFEEVWLRTSSAQRGRL